MFAKFFVGLLLVTSAQVHASPLVSRNNDFLPELLKFLNNAGLTGYAGELENWSQTDKGQEFVRRLDYGKRTLYVPTNEALKNAKWTRQTGSAQPMSWGATDDGSNPGKRTDDKDEKSGRVVKPTLWKDPDQVNLSGRPQVQVIDYYSDDHRVLRGTTQNATAKTVGTYRNIYVKEVDTKLNAPLSMKETLCAGLVDETPKGPTAFTDALDSVGLKDDVNTKPSVTVFAPISFPSNFDKNDVETHILWNDVLYSPDLKDEDTTIAASGETLKIERYYDQIYVIHGNNKARIIRSDVTSDNGVVHVLDKPLTSK